LGSRQMTQDPSQRSLKRYPMGSYTMGDLERTQHNGIFQLSLPI
jgi:hypothetical protein